MCVKLRLMADKAAGCSAQYVQPVTGRRRGKRDPERRAERRSASRLPTCHGMQMLASAFDADGFRFHFLPWRTLPPPDEGPGGIHLEVDGATKGKSAAARSWMGAEEKERDDRGPGENMIKRDNKGATRRGLYSLLVLTAGDIVPAHGIREVDL